MLSWCLKHRISKELPKRRLIISEHVCSLFPWTCEKVLKWNLTCWWTFSLRSEPRPVYHPYSVSMRDSEEQRSKDRVNTHLSVSWLLMTNSEAHRGQSEEQGSDCRKRRQKNNKDCILFPANNSPQDSKWLNTNESLYRTKTFGAS